MSRRSKVLRRSCAAKVAPSKPSRLATIEGIDKQYDEIKGRPVAALLANAGRGLGKAFFDQKFVETRFVVDTNITGTAAICACWARAASLSPARSRALSRALTKPSTTGRKL